MLMNMGSLIPAVGRDLAGSLNIEGGNLKASLTGYGLSEGIILYLLFFVFLCILVLHFRPHPRSRKPKH